MLGPGDALEVGQTLAEGINDGSKLGMPEKLGLLDGLVLG